MPRIKAVSKKHIRILIIRFSSIGDIVLTTPLINAIKADYPDAILDYLTLPEYGSLLKDNPYIDNLYYHERDKGIVYAIGNAFILNRNKYDYIFDLHRSTRSMIYRTLIKARKKTALVKNYIKRFLLIKLKLNLYKKPYSIVERYFNTANILKVTRGDKSEIWIQHADYNRALAKINSILKTDYSSVAGNKVVKIENPVSRARNKFVCIMPFARWKTKEWGDENFTGLAARILSENEITVLIFGGKDDMDRAGLIAEKAGNRVISLAGKLDLTEVSILLSLSSCLVTNDTGIMHIGGAVSIPVIAIFGSTTEELGFFPYKSKGEVIQTGVKCRPCTAKGLNDCPGKHFSCMSEISTDSVYSIVKKYI
jgi:lipopolysaccharide heptosyltransferase II